MKTYTKPSHLKTLRIAGFAAALLAGTAIVAPNDAWAINALTVNAGTVVAPYTTAPQFQMNKKVTITFTLAGNTATGNLNLYAVYYNDTAANAAAGNATVLGITQVGATAATPGTGLVTFNGTLTSLANAKSVVFVMTDSLADTVGGNAINGTAGVVLFDPITAVTNANITAAYAAAVTASPALDQLTNGQVSTFGQIAAIRAKAIDLATNYAFTPLTANKAINAGNTTCVYVNFNAYTNGITDGASVTNHMSVAVGGTTTTSFGESLCGGGAVASNTSQTVKFDADATAGNSAPFTGLIDTVTFDGTALSGAAGITDVAGNPLTAATLTPVATLTTPSFTSTGTAKGILTLGAPGLADGIAARAALYGTGVTAGTDAFVSTTGSANITLRLAESVVSAGFNADDDLVLPAAMGTTANWAAPAQQLTFTIPTAAATTALRVCNDGRVFTQTLATTPGNTWNPVTCTAAGGVATPLVFDIKNGASAMMTAVGSLAIAGATGAPVQVYVGTPRGITSIATTDIAGGSQDGLVDGVTLTFGNPVTGASGGSGIQLVGRSALTTALTNGTTIAPAAPTAATVFTAVATNTADLTAGANETLNTDAVNLSSVGSKMPPYSVRITGTPTWTYTNVYKTADGTATVPIEVLGGANAIAPALPYAPVAPTALGIGDGVAPFLVSATRLTGAGANSGEFRLVFSESMADLAGATTRNNDIQTNTNSTLGLDVLNAGVGTPNIGLLAADATNKTVRIYNVDNSVINGTSNIGISAANQSAALKVLGSDGNPAGTRVVNLGTATALPDVAAPTVVNASAIVDANNKITNILVFFNKPIALTGSSVQTDFTFDVDPGNGAFGITGVGFASASAGSGSNNYILNLVVPGTGVTLQNLEAGRIRLNYTGTASNFVSDTVTPPNNMAATGGSPIAVQLPRNSTRTFTQEIRGKITTDGTAAVEQGTIVRADLVNFNTDGTTIVSGIVTVPFGARVITTVPTFGATSFVSFANVYALLSAAALQGQAQLPAFMAVYAADANGNAKIALDSDQAGALGATNAAAIVYPVNINTATGSITSSVAGINGSLPFVPNPAAKTLVAYNQGGIVAAAAAGEGPVVDTTAGTYVPAYGVVGTSGNYRLNVGSNTSRPGAFVIISVKRPNSATWTQISSADPTFVNFLPFNKDKTTVGITNGTTTSNPNTNTTDFGTSLGANGTTVNLNIRLDRILSSAVPAYAGWEVVGLTGELARNTPLTNFETRRFLTTIKTDSGAPFSNWYQTSAGALAADAVLNEAFVLNANSVASSFELTGGNQIDNIKGALAAGNGIALKNQTGGATIFYPVSSLTAAPKNLAAGWHLLTAQASNGSPATFGGTSAPNQKVGMVIQAGGGGQAKTWIADAATNSTVVTNNTLTALTAGQAYFVYLTAPVTGFTFQ